MEAVSQALRSLVRALEEVGVRYAIVGGLAVIAHGHDRLTRDVDAMVVDADERLDEIIAAMGRHGLVPVRQDPARMARRERVLYLATATGRRVDILLGFIPYERASVDRAEMMDTRDGESIRVASVEDLIILKLIASRDRDLSDIARLVELHPNLNRATIEEVVREVAELLEQPELLANMDRLLPRG